MSRVDHGETAARVRELASAAVPGRLGRGPRPFLLLAAVLLVLLALIPLALRRATWTPADLVIGNGPEPRSLDPAASSAAAEGRVISFLFEGLTVPDPVTLAPRPGLAESWDVSDAGRTVTFHLRDGLTFSDGVALTAEGIVWSFQRFLSPATAAEYASLLWCIEGAEETTRQRVTVGETVRLHLTSGDDVDGTLLEASDTRLSVQTTEGRRDVSRSAMSYVIPHPDRLGIRALDQKTVVFRLKEPVAWFPSLMGFFATMPVPRHVIERFGDQWVKAENFVSNGPFVLERRRLRDRLRLRKNPQYWDARNVRLETVDLLISDSLETLLNLYVAREVDWITDVPTSAIPTLLATRGPEKTNEFRVGLQLGTYFYRVNTRRPPFDDPSIRRALSLAIDRTALVESVTRCGEKIASSLVPPSLVGYTPPDGGGYDPPAARAALAEGLARKGLSTLPPVEILYNTSDQHRRIAELIQHQWRTTLGIETRLVSMEFGAYKDAVRQGEYTVARASWLGDYPDPTTFLDVFTGKAPNNQTGWSDPIYDRLVLVDARRLLDPDARSRVLAQAEERLLDAAPILPVYHYVTRNLVSPRVRGFSPTLLDVHPPKFLSVEGPR